jgi:hypothetical protein
MLIAKEIFPRAVDWSALAYSHNFVTARSNEQI